MFKKLIHIFIVTTFLACLFINGPAVQGMAQISSSPLNCRFGITSPSDPGSIDLTKLRVSALLNWGVAKPSNLPAGTDYIFVLRMSDKLIPAPDTRTYYEKSVDDIATLVPANPGAYWEVGNEPDTIYEIQDDLTAETYADHFYSVASQIRVLDPTAKIGFGSIVQPTHIRLRYLDKAWAELVSKAGSPANASSLIDFWDIHSFILNEIPGQWGTGVPPGFENDHADAVSITNFADTYSISLFSTRVKNFRKWMADKGEQNKPLWITEYGSLFPPIDPPTRNVVNVSDGTTTSFMLKTFDFMLKTLDGTTGMPDDNYHLVQRWFWYSLNDYRYNFGGSWYDPSKNPPKITTVGNGYINYTPKNNVKPEFHFTIDPITVSADLTKLNFGVINSGSSMQGAARIWAYFDDPNNEAPVASLDTDMIEGCGGMMDVSMDKPTIPAGASEIFLRLDTNGDQIPNAGDEIKSININTGLARSPVDKKVLLTQKPTFTWDDVPGGTSYNLQISTSLNFLSYVLNTTTSSANYTMTSNLTANLPMYWRTRAVVGGVPGPWSAVFSFTTANPPSIPVLLSPSNNALTTNYRPPLDWKNSSLPMGTTFGYYRVQVANDNTFATPLLDVQVSDLMTSVFTPTTNLDPNKIYYWRVRAYNSIGQFSAWASIRSFRTAILPPVLSSPTDTTNVPSRRPTLDWGDVSGASGYTVQISRYSNFSSTVMTGSPTASTFTPLGDLPAQTLLYWRVQAKGINGPSLWSFPTLSFTTANPPSIPLLLSPSNSALVTNDLPRLDWSNSSLPMGTTFGYYRVQVAEVPDKTFAAPKLDVQVLPGLITNSEFTPAAALDPNKIYYWRVQAYNTLGQYSAWSSIRSFRTAILAPVLLLPSDGSLNEPRRPVLDWGDVSGANGYSVQISRYKSFSSTVKTTSTTASTYTPTSDLPANVLLYWRVQAKGINGPSLWSAPWSFNVDAPPALTSLSPEDNALVLMDHPTLTWESEMSAAGMDFASYQVQVAMDATFTIPILDIKLSDQSNYSYTFTKDLTPDSVYYWRVRQYNTAGQYSDWTDTRSFRTPIQAPTLTAP